MRAVRAMIAILWTFLLVCAMVWPLEATADPRSLSWGVGVGLRTPGHGQEKDFLCGPEVQPRARLELSERFSLEVSGFLNTSRSLSGKHVSQSAFGATAMPMYFFTSPQFAQANGRSYVGLGPVVRLAKLQGYLWWKELWPILEYESIAEERSDIHDKWDSSFGAMVAIGGEMPVGLGKALTLDLRYMYFFDKEETIEYGEEGRGAILESDEEQWFLPTWGEYRGDLLPRKAIAVSIGFLF